MEGSNYTIHQDIVDRCLKGDRSAYSELYELYSKAMYNVGLRLLSNASDAEDVLQDAFVSAFKNLSSFKGDSSFGSWLKRIVINKSLNLIKKRNNQLIASDVIPEVIDDSEAGTVIDVKLDVERIKWAMSQLPDGYRTVLSLYLFEGYDHIEIGEILGISTSTSKSQYNRSKKRLKEILENQFS